MPDLRLRSTLLVSFSLVFLIFSVFLGLVRAEQCSMVFQMRRLLRRVKVLFFQIEFAGMSPWRWPITPVDLELW